ncbi:LysR family transcriptional regulator [Haematospirillum sp. H1815]|uniref:LysR family transcriptional regulator n=1 Tax=Haematospirillum sp. H1815 TaxID=2723108 RepID=UPI001FD7396D|nr:LysR family transcriptional regulator [Haematospirillum sp. H1815]
MAGRQGSMMDWDKLRVFHTVAEAGSFTHAGDVLHLSQSAVSRQISALEESLRVSLFHRHARGLILTEQGELLYHTVHEVFARLSMVEARITESRERPEGLLKVTTTVAFGSVWLTPRITDFMEQYPSIEISLLLDDQEVDLAMRAADVAIRFNAPRQPDLIQRHLINLHYNVYAAPEYLQKHGTPNTPADLDNHRLITYGDDSKAPVDNMNWLLSAGTTTPRSAVLRINNIYGIYRAVQSGLGIAALPDYFASVASNLVQVLPELRGPSFDCYFVYPEELRHSKRVMVFRDFLLQKLQKDNTPAP